MKSGPCPTSVTAARDVWDCGCRATQLLGSQVAEIHGNPWTYGNPRIAATSPVTTQSIGTNLAEILFIPIPSYSIYFWDMIIESWQSFQEQRLATTSCVQAVIVFLQQCIYCHLSSQPAWKKHNHDETTNHNRKKDVHITVSMYMYFHPSILNSSSHPLCLFWYSLTRTRRKINEKCRFQMKKCRLQMEKPRLTNVVYYFFSDLMWFVCSCRGLFVPVEVWIVSQDKEGEGEEEEEHYQCHKEEVKRHPKTQSRPEQQQQQQQKQEEQQRQRRQRRQCPRSHPHAPQPPQPFPWPPPRPLLFIWITTDPKPRCKESTRGCAMAMARLMSWDMKAGPGHSSTAWDDKLYSAIVCPNRKYGLTFEICSRFVKSKCAIANDLQWLCSATKTPRKHHFNIVEGFSSCLFPTKLHSDTYQV